MTRVSRLSWCEAQVVLSVQVRDLLVEFEVDLIITLLMVYLECFYLVLFLV